jgi:hypothetical protein
VTFCIDASVRIVTKSPKIGLGPLLIFSISLMPRYLSGLMHSWPEAARLCPIKGLYPDKYVLFGQKMAVCLGRLYERTHRLPVLKEGNILLQLITALRPPLQLKYACVKQSSWRIAIEVSRG